MSSLRTLLLASLLTVLHLVLSVDAKGGGKGSSSKGSKNKSKSKTKTNPVVFKENGRCYDAQHIEMKCPAKKKTALIVGIIIAVIAAILILVFAIWFFRRRSQKKNKKSRDVHTKELDDASSEYDSIVPLVYGVTKEKDTEYGYKDKSANV